MPLEGLGCSVPLLRRGWRLEAISVESILNMWKIELSGQATDILELKQLAPCCDCVLVAAPDAQYCLGGPAFDHVTTAEEMEAEAERVLILLNGLARLERFEHHPVRIGERIYGPQRPGAPLFYRTRAPKSAWQP